jgi:hypothetical protein
MLRRDEKTFYKSVRRSGRAAGLKVNRIENEVESGWPDVIFRGDGNYHAYAELKIAEGPNARVEVRAEQINWAEEHAEMGGIVHMLALCDRDKSVFWEVPAHRFRHVAEHGCLGEPCYAMRHMAMVISRWTGIYVNLQQSHPTFVEERSRLAQAKSRVSVSGAAMSILRRSGIRRTRNNRGPHHPESPWRD